jgi:hypothetical protein
VQDRDDAQRKLHSQKHLRAESVQCIRA